MTETGTPVPLPRSTSMSYLHRALVTVFAAAGLSLATTTPVLAAAQEESRKESAKIGWFPLGLAFGELQLFGEHLGEEVENLVDHRDGLFALLW